MSNNTDNSYEVVLSSIYNQIQNGNNNYLIPFLESEPGMSKTFTIKKFAESRGGVGLWNLSSIDPVDLTGMPWIDENGVQRYARPSILNQEEGIIFFDELNRIQNEDVRTALLSLFVDKEINGHKLSPKVMIVTAGNPYGTGNSTKKFDKALSDRITVIKFNRTYDEWLDYMFENHQSNNLLKFFFSNPQTFNSRLANKELKYSFRRLEYAYNTVTYGGDSEGVTLNYTLSPEVFHGYRDFVRKTLASYSDLKAGKWRADAEGKDAVMNKAILIDLISDLEKYPKFTDLEGKRINEFLHTVNAQLKSYLFDRLTKSVMIGRDFESVKSNWMQVRLFSGLQEYSNFILGKTK